MLTTPRTKTYVLDLHDCNGPWSPEVEGVLILDLDGTLRYMPEDFYARTSDNQEISPSVLSKAWEYRRAGWIVCAATNQSGVGRGVRTHDEVLETLKVTDNLCGGLFTSMYYCPHEYHEDGSSLCKCRKPQPGMLLTAMAGHRHGIMVGDRPEDYAAAKAAGIDFLYVADFAPLYQKTRIGIWPHVPNSLIGPARLVWSAIKHDSPHSASTRHAIRSAVQLSEYNIEQGVEFGVQVDLIAKAAWPVVLWASTSEDLSLAGWLNVACALGAEVKASRMSLLKLESLLRYASSMPNLLWQNLQKVVEEG